MLERTSRFILEVFPYLSAAVIAAVIVPGYLYSQVHGFYRPERQYMRGPGPKWREQHGRR